MIMPVLASIYCCIDLFCCKEFNRVEYQTSLNRLCSVDICTSSLQLTFVFLNPSSFHLPLLAHDFWALILAC